jgi:hypothetical protein
VRILTQRRTKTFSGYDDDDDDDDDDVHDK